MCEKLGVSQGLAKYYIKKHKSYYYAEKEFRNDEKSIGKILDTF